MRGLKKCWSWYAEQLKQFTPYVNVPLYIGGADCPETTAMLRQMFLDTGLPMPEIRCVPISCPIGTHVGPGLTRVCRAAA